ncbi:MAG: methyltransferase domain-containing protein [Polyangiaceae bacterium]
MKRVALGFISSLLLAACGGSPPPPSTAAATPASPAAPVTTAAQTTTTSASSTTGMTPDSIKSLLAASDRTDSDRKTDTLRHPEAFLQFIGIAPGMHVADLGSGTGYTTELLARAVGPDGTVYSQNDPELIKKFFDKPLTERLARPANKNVTREDRKFDDPLPADAKNNLDIVVDYIFYHDAVSLGTDRDKMNGAVFGALKPGGTYVIVDASAKSGDGVNDTKTLHRIDENIVKTEVQKAGFTFVSSADFLRNPSDTRDWNSSPKAAGDRRGTEDRFVFKFQKPTK